MLKRFVALTMLAAFAPASWAEPIDTDPADNLCRCAALWVIMSDVAGKQGKSGTQEVYRLKAEKYLKAATLSLALQRHEEIKAGDRDLLENKIKPYVMRKAQENGARYLSLIESQDTDTVANEGGACAAVEPKVDEIVSLWDRATGF